MWRPPEMRVFLIIGVLIPGIVTSSSNKESGIDEEERAKEFLKKLELEVRPVCHRRAISEWNFHTNLTEANQKEALEASLEYSKFWRGVWETAKTYHWRSFQDPSVRRQFSLMTTLGVAILPENLLKKYNTLKQSMESKFGRANVCDFYNRTKCNLSLEPEITNIFLHSRNPAELEHIWFQWRNITGRTLKDNYTEFVSLLQTVAKLNNFSSATEYELRSYATEELSAASFRSQVDTMWETLRPFYEQLHAYVRHKLIQFYGEDEFSDDGLIPAHLLGNLWAETWENVEDMVIPFNKKQSFNITQRMQEMNLKPIDMAKLAERFFVSLGLPSLPSSFWNNSIFEKPTDREVICHASAWDLCLKGDFRIKQCTTITETDLLTLHHELGHIYYQLSYAHLPKVFRDGANAGFHEAIGDLIALSVQTPTHMKSIGLIDHYEDDEESEINYLLRIALVKIAFLPYGFILDKWKWEGPYSGAEDGVKGDLNCQWWKLREEIQGVGRPKHVKNGKEFLDPASKYHIVINVPYIRYFVSMILQFQLHEALCNEAKNTRPLHLCDIYNSKSAGRKLETLLSLGASEPWPKALSSVTGTETLTSKPMLKYFEPLYKWLIKENRKNNQTAGWKRGMTCPNNTATVNQATCRLYQSILLFWLIKSLSSLINSLWNFP